MEAAKGTAPHGVSSTWFSRTGCKFSRSRPASRSVDNTRTRVRQRNSPQSVPEYHSKSNARGGILRLSAQVSRGLLVFTIFVAFQEALAASPGPHAAERKRRGSARVGRVQTGLDMLEAQKFAPLRGKRIGIITNHTGLDAQ